ncbi:MAG: DUF4249 domain-containing protein [Bacteroidota bacterium]
MSFRLIFLLLITTALFGCELDLEVPFPKHEAKLVVNSYLTEDDDIRVFLTRSYGLLDDINENDLWIEDATVTIKEDGVEKGSLAYRDTTFTDSIYSYPPKSFRYAQYSQEGLRPVPGKVYSLEVSHPDYGTVTSETKMPNQTKLIDIEYNLNFEVNRWTQPDGTVYINRRATVDFEVEDPGDEENYYYFELWVAYTMPSFPEDTFYSQVYMTHNAYRDVEGYWVGDDIPTPDTDFNGGKGKIRTLAYFPFGNGREDLVENAELLGLEVKASSVSKELYDYKQKYSQQKEFQLDGVESALIPNEPVSVPSNIEGGYGIFAGSNTATFLFDPK